MTVITPPARSAIPGLVVHGPLQAILLADAVDRAHPDQVVSSFSFRAYRPPAFDDHELHLRACDRAMSRAGSSSRHSATVA